MTDTIDRAKLEETIKRIRALRKDWPAGEIGTDSLLALADAAEKHLATLPKTKMVEVEGAPTKHARTRVTEYWLISYAFWGYRSGEDGRWMPAAVSADNEAEATKHAKWLWNQLQYDCIRVTGPHQQEVPQ